MVHTSNLTRGATRLVAIGLFVALLCAAGIPLLDVAATPLGATSPTLGAAASYSVLGGQTVTNTGPTTMSGDLGVSPGSAVTGFPPGIVGPPGTIHAGDAQAAAAQIANIAAFTFLDQGCDMTYPGTKDLVGENLVAGVYCADAFRLSGTLTLSGAGVWIFKSAADLITSGTANVVGGDPCNVWWREVSSATLGTNTSLIGSVLASTSMTVQTGASLNGRALVQTGAVTLDSNAITGPSCGVANTPVPGATDTPVPGATDTPVPGATDTPLPAATDTPIPVPTNTRRPTQKKTPTPAATDTPIPAAPDTPIPAATDTPIPAAPDTPIPAVTAPTPPIARLPNTGGDPSRRADFLWVAVPAAWVVGALALGLSVRARRRERRARR
jgi:Ice-binding-like